MLRWATSQDFLGSSELVRCNVHRGKCRGAFQVSGLTFLRISWALIWKRSPTPEFPNNTEKHRGRSAKLSHLNPRSHAELGCELPCVEHSVVDAWHRNGLQEATP